MIAILTAFLAWAPSALASEAPCKRVDCLLEAASIRQADEGLDEIGRKVVVYSSAGVETRVYLTPAGTIDEIFSFRVPHGILLRHERFGERDRFRRIYDPQGRLEAERTIRRLGHSDLLSWEERRYAKGILIRELTWVMRESQAGARPPASCLSEVRPPSSMPSDLAGVVSHVFDERTGSGDIRIRKDASCDGLESVLQDSLQRGLECMSSGHGASTRSRSDAHFLVAMMSRSSQPFEVRCDLMGEIDPATLVESSDAGLGRATMCPGDGNSTPAGNPPYPGVRLRRHRPNGSPLPEAVIRSTFFHEMLHTLGYPHGHFPDVAYNCQVCCFGNDAGTVPPGAAGPCDLCRMNDSPTEITAANAGPKLAEQLVTLFQADASEGQMMMVLSPMIARALEVRSGNALVGAARYAAQICAAPQRGGSVDSPQCPRSVRAAWALIMGVQGQLESGTPRPAWLTASMNADERRLLGTVTASLSRSGSAHGGGATNSEAGSRTGMNMSVMALSARARGASPADSVRAGLEWYRTTICPEMGLAGLASGTGTRTRATAAVFRNTVLPALGVSAQQLPSDLSAQLQALSTGSISSGGGICP